MAEDNHDFIERTQSRARLVTGSELSPDDLAKEFSKFDQSARVDFLRELEADQKYAEYTPRQAADIYAIRSRLKGRHELLNKVGR